MITFLRAILCMEASLVCILQKKNTTQILRQLSIYIYGKYLCWNKPLGFGALFIFNLCLIFDSDQHMDIIIAILLNQVNGL